MSKKVNEELEETVFYEEIPQENRKALDFMVAIDEYHDHIKSYITGRILTVIDVILMNDDQRKAAKDLVHSAIEDMHRKQNKLCGAIFDRVNESLYGIRPERLNPPSKDDVIMPSIVK